MEQEYEGNDRFVFITSYANVERGIAIPPTFRVTNRGTKKGEWEFVGIKILSFFFPSFFLSKSLRLLRNSKKRKNKNDHCQGDARRPAAGSRNRWKYEKEKSSGQRVPRIQACSMLRKRGARATIALTHQLHLVTNALVTNRRRWRRFVVNQSVNCVSAFSRFPWWQGHFSKPTIYHPRATIHSSLARYTPALGAGHTCPIDVSLFDTRLKCAEGPPLFPFPFPFFFSPHFSFSANFFTSSNLSIYQHFRSTLIIFVISEEILCDFYSFSEIF